MNIEVDYILALRHDSYLSVILAYIMASNSQDLSHASLDTRPNPDEMISLGLKIVAVEVDRAIFSSNSQAVASKV